MFTATTQPERQRDSLRRRRRLRDTPGLDLVAETSSAIVNNKEPVVVAQHSSRQGPNAHSSKGTTEFTSLTDKEDRPATGTTTMSEPSLLSTLFSASHSSDTNDDADDEAEDEAPAQADVGAEGESVPATGREGEDQGDVILPSQNGRQNDIRNGKSSDGNGQERAEKDRGYYTNPYSPFWVRVSKVLWWIVVLLLVYDVCLYWSRFGWGTAGWDDWRWRAYLREVWEESEW